MKSHFSDEFLEMMPAGEDERVLMYMTLQEVFTTQLKSKIEKYAITGIHYSEMKNEGYFYRKYTLYNGDELFYKTALKKVEDAWKVVNDEPSPGYSTDEDEYEDVFIQSKNKETKKGE